MDAYRLLVVDDDRDTRELLREALENEGFTVVVAANGFEAMTKLEERPPRLVLLDLMMPVLDGWQLLERMREHPELQRVPVCVLSALEQDPPGGVEYVLQKPVPFQAVLGVVARVR
jgi:CheY-like chemotaxis protein